MVSKKQLAESEAFSNDATFKLLGFEYQKLIALEKCLDAKPNERIWIECRGDVANKDTSMEIKHHSSNHNITSNSEDVWNTLKNYITEINITQTFTNLILHTTSSIPNSSIFFDWNRLAIAEKRRKVLNHTPSATIKSYYETVAKCSEENLKLILGRFEIISNQPKIEEMWENLKKHSALIIVPLNLRDQAIQELYGYITKQAISNPNMWQIDINDFQRDMRHSISKFTTDKVPFPFISEGSVQPKKKNGELIFIQKMKDIKLKKKNQEIAISDYFRAQETQITMLSSSPTLRDSLERYDNNIERDLENEKSSTSYDLSESDINTEKADKESRDLYFRCIRKPEAAITGVADVQKYYKDGRVHHVIDEGTFEWKYREDDI
ncbi:MAG: hypothetical protein COB30_009450 [Ectothiorhodospiraceae bacterium]|nr:hypothetical protein [Ectothiorhodospiraceae bacterium]